MTRITLALGSAAALALSATAMHAQSEIDTDGDGVFTMAELQAAYPDLTEDTFVMIDANADGSVDADELKAAQDAGMVAATDG